MTKAIIVYCSLDDEDRVEIPGYECYTIHEFTTELILKLIDLNPKKSFGGVVVDKIDPEAPWNSGAFWLFDEQQNPHEDQEHTERALRHISQEQLDHFLANCGEYVEVKIHDYYLDS